MVQRILRVTRDTVFKLRAEQSSQLSAEEKYSVAAGTTFEIQSYAYADVNGDFNGHIKITLLNTEIRGLNTWFVYSLHAKVEFDGVVVYPVEDQSGVHVLQINADTVFKLRPLPSSVLPADALFSVKRGQSFQLHSYAFADSTGDFNNHIRFALRNREDFIRELSTWYAYTGHVYVEYDGKVMYPREASNIFGLRITENTVFKRRPIALNQLTDEEKASIPAGRTFKLDSYAYADAQGSFNGHIKFTLKYAKDNIRDMNTWYVYDGHARVEQSGKVVYPAPKPGSPIYSGRAFKLPGNSTTFYTDQPIIPGGSFTWGDATHDATRIPDTVTIVNNMIALARELQKARNQIGRPFLINSWYRPPAINDSVGGVPNSQHLYGKAVDLQVDGYSGRSLANAVMLWWNGGVGIYSNLPDVLHLDIGPRRVWGF
ncbi:MAG: D-Ala-D-Ala carboxypeptidase family metallohydrolase [Leptolyngbyaceae cyanobacterium bins.302]|nr:D-Ala-D-Ala carboxypeptidase family metallohydrolase [Leptolyngbyaceae cyanobacterium bins.302]